MSIFKQISEIETRGETVALCTIVRANGSTPRRAGSKMLVFPDGRTSGTIGGGEMEGRVIAEALAALEDGAPRVLDYAMTDPQRGDPGVCGGQLEVYVEPILPQPAVVVIGGGHVGKAVAYLAKWLGFFVVVSDDREGFASEEQAPGADQYHTGEIDDLLNTIKVHGQTAIVLTTRNVKVDLNAIPALLATPAAYIGVIGSRRRWETTQKNLLEAGIKPEALARVVSPMGLELNAETPEEIAVSILAEIVMLRRGGSGGRMDPKEGG